MNIEEKHSGEPLETTDSYLFWHFDKMRLIRGTLYVNRYNIMVYLSGPIWLH